MTRQAVNFTAIGRLPRPNDNVAIATRTLSAGSEIALAGTHFTLDFTVLEGHRFAIAPIAVGEPLLSWDMPFGLATQPISPGQYVCNAAMIEALNGRSIDFALPVRPNFRDHIVPFTLDEDRFQPGQQVERYAHERTFLGYRRSAARGVGTRNMVVVLGATSSTASYARALAERLQPYAALHTGMDGIVPIAHTEGGGYAQINNRDYLLRALAGLIVHPNVAAVLIADLETDPVNGRLLQTFMREQGYPLDDVRHGFLTLSGDWQADLARGEAVVERWLPEVGALQRTPESLAHLSVALQCGGSDAFSGISGNPLASSVAKEIVRYGGRAVLAETDELIGAEGYVLRNVRNLETAHAFLDFVAEFKERLAWHGVTAEGNPSGGNKLRGIYNIVHKSIGAAAKLHPDVRLDHVVDYAQRMVEPGYYFMNTPGNDLESIAGQVAGGSNLIIFVTGNGSITNFPFVPTLKVMTTTSRFELLAREMDVNAGAYLDGVSMDTLTEQTLDLLVEIASGQPSRGEAAGHSQISIWRNWQQRDRSRLPLILDREKPSGSPIPIEADEQIVDAGSIASFASLRSRPARIGLVLPTSLCSGQIARLATDRLNASHPGRTGLIDRFATLIHTEGCGVAFASTHEVYAETMIGYATHPLVAACLFLEHGCEKAHNDYIGSLLRARGLAREEFGWASVQLDGGIESVIEKVVGYFDRLESGQRQRGQSLSVAMLVEGDLPDPIARSLAQVARALVGAGGTAVIPDSGAPAASSVFLDALRLSDEPNATLAYGQSVQQPGFHIMETPTPHWAETVTGLGATGADVILAFSDQQRAGHPFVPLLMLGTDRARSGLDLLLEGYPARWPEQIWRAIGEVVNGTRQPASLVQNNVDFQLTRGLLGIST